MRIKHTYFLIIGLFFLLGFNVNAAAAAEFIFPSKGGNVNLSSGEIVKNLYVAGNMISIEGEIKKDIYAAGNMVTVGGPVEDNVFAVGGTIMLGNDVGGNVHAAGGNVIIRGVIMEDLFVGAGNVLIAKSASIGGDLVVGGGTVDIEGQVAGKTLIGGGEVTVNGKISGPMKIEANKLTIGDAAEIEMGFKYASPQEAAISESANIKGQIDFEQRSVRRSASPYSFKHAFAFFSGMFLLKILILIISGLILVYFFKNALKGIIRGGFENFWRDLGIGFVALILVPIIVIILLITVLGAYLAGLLGLIYALLLMLSSLIANIAFGSWLIKIFKKEGKYRVRWQEVVIGVIVLNLICLVPFIGWLACFVFMLVSLGSMLVLAQKMIAAKM